MENSYRVLILTDHTNHSKENSLYDLVVKMVAHSKTKSVSIASRGNAINSDFFNCKFNAKLYATNANENFKYDEFSNPLTQHLELCNLNSFDLVWLRMPPPLSEEFLNHISSVFHDKCIINNPKGINITGSKAYLMNFPEVCPPMKICTNLEDIISYKNQFPIVLKPFREYGGRGIVRIENDEVWEGKDIITFEEFANRYENEKIEYLAVKFLKNVNQGDKRIVVVNGQIIGASLRLPPTDSWLCNVAMGGSSTVSDVDNEEKTIIKLIDPYLSKLGIVMYGVDTLVDDNGKRVLSEINTTSIGGLPQMAAFKQQPLVEKTIDEIWNYFEKYSQTKN